MMDNSEIVEKFNSVFDIDNIDDNWPFKKTAWSGYILYPNDLVVLSELQFDVIRSVAHFFKEDKFLIVDAEVEREDLMKLKYAKYLNINDSYDDFVDLHDAVTDHVYMSVYGNWGVVSRHNLVSIFSSDESGLRQFKELYKNWPEDYRNFCADMSEEYPHFSVDRFDPKGKLIKKY